MEKKPKAVRSASVIPSIDGPAIERFKASHGLTVADSCSVLGIATLHKFGETVRKSADDINLSLALLVRFYTAHPDMVPKLRPMNIIDAYDMFQKVLGGNVMNESAFAFLLGRTPGSGYRWIRQNGRVTPQIARILDRFTELRRLGASDEAVVHGWIDIVRAECLARGREFILDRGKRLTQPKAAVSSSARRQRKAAGTKRTRHASQER